MALHPLTTRPVESAQSGYESLGRHSRSSVAKVRRRTLFFIRYIFEAVGRLLPIIENRRRTLFFVRYILAKPRSKVLGRLLPIIENSFRHPWVAEVRLQIRFWPGLGDLLPGIPSI